MRLLVATRNPGKVREYERLLDGCGYEIVGLQSYGDLSVEETGSSFEENARLKATQCARVTGMFTLADDSGLEVDALNGEPGVYSARYAGVGASDAQRTQKLLAALSTVPPGKRGARFRCVIALAWPDGRCESFEGKCEGEIAFEAKGSFGFGYDPVFYMPEHGQTMAELPAEFKNQISHRARAMALARVRLQELVTEAQRTQTL
ncbi:MAG: XTP/dITP diphosphatase [Thermoflexales bacterium]|nr:XTP/dITP diphosphatase [Thermoflexales bacterium]